MPGEKKAAFSLTTPFVPRGGRENLAAFAKVNSDPGPDYGKIKVLQLQRSTNIAGPSQVSSNFEAKPEVATSLSLLRQGGSNVELGNLLTLPVGGGCSMYNLFMFALLQIPRRTHCCKSFGLLW